MGARLVITNSCPNCGHAAAIRLSGYQENDGTFTVPVIVDQAAASAHAAPPSADHPCPEEKQS